jgi:hypothetical protein
MRQSISQALKREVFRVGLNVRAEAQTYLRGKSNDKSRNNTRFQQEQHQIPASLRDDIEVLRGWVVGIGWGL